MSNPAWIVDRNRNLEKAQQEVKVTEWLAEMDKMALLPVRR